MDTRTIKSMTDEECKNLVYLMIRRYPNRWETDFPKDMNISAEDCRTLYDAYHDIVENEIEREYLNNADGIPTVDELVRLGMKRLRDTIEKSDDPSKVSRTIEILSGLPNDSSFKREKKKTIFEIAQDKAKAL